MKIIEVSSTSKTGREETNEDTWCVTEHYACVIDGATDISGRRFQGDSPGRTIAQWIKQAVTELPPQADIEEIMGRINATLQERYKEQGLYDTLLDSETGCPSASMALYSRFHHCVWLIGDCQCMVEGVLHENSKEADHIFAAARALFLEAELASGKTVEQLAEQDTGFAAIVPFIRQHFALRNQSAEYQYAYGEITGFGFIRSLSKTVLLPPSVSSLVLASDGYPELKSELAAAEQVLQELLEHDPLCIGERKQVKGRMKGNVSYDDRTYLRVGF